MQKYEMTVSVEIRQRDDYNSGGALRVNESFDFQATDFSSLCGVLMRFHALAEEVKKLSGDKPR